MERLLNVFLQRRIRRSCPPGRVLQVQGNAEQEIVNIVGHSAGQAAQCLQSVRLSQMFFQGTLLGNVFGDSLDDFFPVLRYAAAQAGQHQSAVTAFPPGLDGAELGLPIGDRYQVPAIGVGMKHIAGYAKGQHLRFSGISEHLHQGEVGT